ncbi:MAG: rRNA maturation RNase YbeY [Anaerolinea sp.]|nr:rRNA maturation RNase YbeY [Anaerolinea sp.]
MLQLLIRPYYRNKVNKEGLLIAANSALGLCMEKEVSVGMVITGDAEIHALNKEYRDVDKPTDVLSFNQNFVDPETGIEYLGDIIVSIPRAKAQASKSGHTLDQELQLLVIHGVLHLAGFNHDTPARQKKMWFLQSTILQALENPLCKNFTSG